MNTGYFSRFPNTVYANTTCLNIMRRAAISNTALQDVTLYYPYEIRDGLREDLLADNYYKDSYLSWLIYLANRIIDPYFGWYMSPTELDESVQLAGYANTFTATSRVKFYRLNWPDYDGVEISPSYYDNELPSMLKKYYNPVFGTNVRIVSYTRKQLDTTVNVNMIMQFDLDTISGNGFVETELVNILSSDTANVVGMAEVLVVTGNTVYVKNVSGNTAANNKLSGWQSETTANVALSTTTYINIPADEFVYWGPVSYWDSYNEANEENKSIVLLKSSLASQVSSMVTKAINGK